MKNATRGWRSPFRIEAKGALRVAWFVSVLTGCAAIIGVPDLMFDEGAPQGHSDGASSDRDGSRSDANERPGGGDAATSCDESKLQTDDKNCGRCGHDCVGGACNGGRCQAIQLGEVSNAPLQYIVATEKHLFVSTNRQVPTQAGGIWRISKSGGAVEPYVTLPKAEAMAILDDTLYFVSDDGAHDGADPVKTGGLYSCLLAAPAPCSPTLIGSAEEARGIAVDDGRVFYPTRGNAYATMVYEPSKTPTVFRNERAPMTFWVDGDLLFYTVAFSPANPDNAAAILWQIPADGGAAIELTRYQHPKAEDGVLVGSRDALYFTAFDWDTTTGGVVRRVPRPGSGLFACDFGGTGNKRPSGVTIDGARIYWTNQGLPASPFEEGSVATCPREGCCTTPEILWTGTGAPVGIVGDDKALYFVTNKTGAIWKVAKP